MKVIVPGGKASLLVSKCKRDGGCKLEVSKAHTPKIRKISPITILPWGTIDFDGIFL